MKRASNNYGRKRLNYKGLGNEQLEQRIIAYESQAQKCKAESIRLKSQLQQVKAAIKQLRHEMGTRMGWF